MYMYIQKKKKKEHARASRELFWFFFFFWELFWKLYSIFKDTNCSVLKCYAKHFIFKVMLESAILKWGKKGLYCVSTGIKGWRYCHIFLSCFLGLWGFGFGLFVCFNKSVLKPTRKRLPTPRVPTLESSDLPSVPWAHPVSLLLSAPPHPQGGILPPSLAPGQLWGLAYLRKVDNRMERTTDAFYASSWDCVGVFLYLILDCLGRYFLLYVFSVAECTRGQDFTSFA